MRFFVGIFASIGDVLHFLGYALVAVFVILVASAMFFASTPVGKFALKIGQWIWYYGPTVALVLLGVVVVGLVLSFFDRF